MGSRPLTLLSTPHHFLKPQDDRGRQTSQQYGSDFKAPGQVGRCVSRRVCVQSQHEDLSPRNAIAWDEKVNVVGSEIISGLIVLVNTAA